MTNITRRAILKSSICGPAVAAFSGFTPPAAHAATESSAAVAETTAGKVRGVTNNGVHIYRGIPYGASTAGASRFMPPRKPEPWTGVRDAFQNGHTSPQNSPAPGAIGWGLRSNAPQGEDCLALNVFAPSGASASSGRRRPVMVWIHGGGYTYGSGGSLGYD